MNPLQKLLHKCLFFVYLLFVSYFLSKIAMQYNAAFMPIPVYIAPCLAFLGALIFQLDQIVVFMKKKGVAVSFLKGNFAFFCVLLFFSLFPVIYFIFPRLRIFSDYTYHLMKNPFPFQLLGGFSAGLLFVQSFQRRTAE